MREDATVARMCRVVTWADYREALRELHTACGAPKYGTVSATSGLAKSAISGLIGTNPVQRPSEANSLRFVEACLAHAHREPESAAAVLASCRETWRRLKSADDGPVEPTAVVSSPAIGTSRLARVGQRMGVLGTVASIIAIVVAASVWLAQPSTGQGPAAQPQLAAGNAQPGCSEAQASQRDVRLHRRWDSVYVCPNSRSMVYEWAAVNGSPIGVLRSNPSWIVCWTHGETIAGSDIWYYTQGDDELGKDALDAWGFISASDLDVAQHPDPGVTRRCSFRTEPPARQR